MTGTLNFVNPLLSGTFSVGQQFTISMDLNDNATLFFGERLDFFTSNGVIRNPVSNGSVTFPNYAASFASSVTNGSMSVRNAETNSFGYDQLQMSFSTAIPEIATGPQAAGYNLSSIEFNFFGDSPPLDMITGSGASFPTADVPFISSDTFNLARSTNSTFHFVLRFTGGTPSGSNFIRGSINTSSFTPAATGFAGWPALAELPEAQRGKNATPANDGVANLIKYALGIPPLQSASSRLPSKIVEGEGDDEGFPIVSYIRVKDLSGITTQVQVSADLGFSSDIATTPIGIEDLGDGTERITIRSNASFSSQSKQFFRIRVIEN